MFWLQILPRFNVGQSLGSVFLGRSPPQASPPGTVLPRVAVEYCVGCKWGLRAAWVAQELLQTFEKELGEVRRRV